MKTRVKREEEKSKYIDSVSYLYYPQYKTGNKWEYFYNNQREGPICSCTIEEAIDYLNKLPNKNLIINN